MTSKTSIYEYAKHGLVLSTDKPALWFYGSHLTFRDLFAKIDSFAGHLSQMGVRQGTVVTIHLPNCPQAVIAIYAVAKLGGICNMVHAQMPSESVKRNMAFTESTFLITYLSECISISDIVLFVDIAAHMGPLFKFFFRLKYHKPRDIQHPFEEFELPFPADYSFPDQSTLADKCAVYLHSSGTTGIPKTVMHCHQALNNWVEDAKCLFHKDSMQDEVFLGVVPLFHGGGLVIDLHQQLSGGGQLVQMLQFDVKTAIRAIKKYKVSILTGPPRMFWRLLDDKSFCVKGSWSIRQCYSAGESCGEALKMAFNNRVGKSHCFCEGYGMTEIVSACFSCGDVHTNLYASGYPLTNCHIGVIDSHQLIHPIGEGEFVVSTNTMMLGYLNDPEASKALEINWNGQKWFRTGDYGRIDKDGYVYFIERLKNTIIHNGYNIFPSEIEDLIREIKQVIDVCVIGVYSKEKKTQIVRACLIVSPNADKKSVENEILKKCSETLPAYAMPKQFRFYDSFPRNALLKVQRRELEQME